MSNGNNLLGFSLLGKEYIMKKISFNRNFSILDLCLGYYGTGYPQPGRKQL